LISHAGRPALSVDDRVRAPADERADAFSTSFAYAGTFSSFGHEVRHDVEIASVENWVGTTLVRDARVEGDTLVLRTPPMVVDAASRVFELTWRRITP
jgi:Lipocalin-like domain